MTTLLCPVSFVELMVGPSETSVPCPRCATRHDAAFLRPRNETSCQCGHRLAAHKPRWGLAYACPTSGCGCRHQPKEKPMRFTVDNVLEHLSAGDGDLDDGIDAFVSIRRPSGYLDVLWVELESTEDDRSDRVTEKFRVTVERA